MKICKFNFFTYLLLISFVSSSLANTEINTSKFKEPTKNEVDVKLDGGDLKKDDLAGGFKSWSIKLGDAILIEEGKEWVLDIKKLKDLSINISTKDTKKIKDIIKGADVQLSQAGKYIIAMQGKEENGFIVDNYFNDIDFYNGLYYLNINILNTEDRAGFWSIVKKRDRKNVVDILDKYKTCNGVKDLVDLGGKNFTLLDYNDFYNKKQLIGNYTNSDLFNLELELTNETYPVVVTFYKNNYSIHSKKDEKCLKVNTSSEYMDLKKSMVLYKQNNKKSEIKQICTEIDANSFLKSKFLFFCIY